MNDNLAALAPENLVISCGMYASTQTLVEAWEELFTSFFEALGLVDLPFAIQNETALALFHQPNFFLGHTCGYPFVRTLSETHETLCVPIFDVPGCDGIQYLSWFITHADNQGESLEDFRGQVVCINSHTSNSGMNVLRAAISPIARNRRFFRKTLISGGHLKSIKLVASKKADLASIDAVTFDQLKRSGQFDPDSIRIIGQSEPCTGLPFVIPRKPHAGRFIDKDVMLDTLNQALEGLIPIQEDALRIRRFERVFDSDYDSIQKMIDRAGMYGYQIIE